MTPGQELLMKCMNRGHIAMFLFGVGVSAAVAMFVFMGAAFGGWNFGMPLALGLLPVFFICWFVANRLLSQSIRELKTAADADLPM